MLFNAAPTQKTRHGARVASQRPKAGFRAPYFRTEAQNLFSFSAAYAISSQLYSAKMKNTDTLYALD